VGRVITGSQPFFQSERLVLQCVRQFVRQHRTLRVRIHPVQQVHRLGLRVVVSRNLLFEHRHQKGLQIEIARQQPEFLKHHFRALQPLGVLVFFHSFLDKVLHLAAFDEAPLHLRLDRQLRILAGEFQDLVHRLEQLLRLLRRNDLFWRSLLGPGALARGSSGFA